jgi:rhodanese-related sulfurtransferase
MIRRILKKLLGRDKQSSPSSPAPTAPKPPPPAPEYDLATIECGAQELWERVQAGESVIIVDVREDFERVQSGFLEGALHIPLRELSTRWEELKEANEIVCYCAAGARSYNAAMLLRSNGLFNATSLEGGLSAWKAISAPVSR